MIEWLGIRNHHIYHRSKKMSKDKLGKVKKGSITSTVSAVQKGLDVSRPKARQALAKYLKVLRS